ncbi:transposable element Tcb2 transposase [Trichonephila clavipes]|nr:transposable element Tcb2 transposase [Trichonephila clavipes]
MVAARSARRVARQLERPNCVVRRCWDQCIREMSFTPTPSSGRSRQTSHREDCHIHLHYGLVSSRTIRRRLAEGHLESRCPLRVLPLTPTHRRECCRARGNWTAVEWDQVDFSDESRFNLSSDGNHVRVWRPRGERLNPDFSLQRYTAPTTGVMYRVSLPTIHGYP